MKSVFIACLLTFGIVWNSAAQAPQDYTTADLIQGLKKANTTGSVLYIAAHPDDENTRLISYLSNHLHVRTGYLSLTRGDGGQNLVGTEKGALMGLLRTQELLEARKIDGGEQFFTRAVDFGYSKNPEETFVFWEKEKILADVVWTIRKFRPDVLITRFPPTSRAGHGHHTASAMLAEEAFELAGDPKAFPEQLKYVDVWQPQSLYHNTSTWWNKELPNLAKENPDEYITVDVGIYNPVLGQSYSEIASESRSMHKSQGFGSGKTRGEKMEYLKFVKGKRAKNNDLFDGAGTTWARYDKSGKIAMALEAAIKNFDPEKPEGITHFLVGARDHILGLNDKYLSYKVAELEELILASAGVFLEAVADDHTYAWGDTIGIEAEIVVRRPANIKCNSVRNPKGQMMMNKGKIATNKSQKVEMKFIAPSENSHPYWLADDYQGIFKVDDQNLRGNPENKPMMVQFDLTVNDQQFSMMRPLVYKWTDRVDGERYRPIAVVPPVTSKLQSKVYIFADGSAQKLVVEVTCHQANPNNVSGAKGTVMLQTSKDWGIGNNNQVYEFKREGEKATFTFDVTPPKGASVEEIEVLLIPDAWDSNHIDRSMILIDYDHAPIQTLIPHSKAKIVRLDIKTEGKNVGYIMGAGDEVPSNLGQIGYNVTELDPNALSTTDLSKFDAILVGIRAYNTERALINGNKSLHNYANEGGIVIVQYNTNRGLVTDEIGPYPMKLSRDRVTDETAEVKFLAPKHAIMTTPNALTKADFDNWVQERGLYFANEWDDKYTALLSWHDPNEDPKNGGLLVADHGKGAFIYTGISFFRQLPAGVPGAYRLLANLISYRPAK